MTIRVYRLIDEAGHAAEQVYESPEYPKAEMEARSAGHAIEALIYELADVELVWTPNGEVTWPPEEETT